MIAIDWTVAGVAILCTFYALYEADVQRMRADCLEHELRQEAKFRQTQQTYVRELHQMYMQAAAERDALLAQQRQGRIIGTLYRN